MCKCCGQINLDSHVDLKQKKLEDMMKKYQNQDGVLISVLQDAQEIYGFLSEQVMETIAREMKIPVAKVFGVATFYSQFRFIPIGRNVIRVCMGTSCHVRGALKVLKTLERELDIKAGETTGDGEFTLETVGCIGACGLAPVISINNKVFGNLTPQMIPEIVEKFK